MENNTTPTVTPDQFPMKWHNFITNKFVVWLGVIAFVLYGVITVASILYLGQTSRIYTYYPGLLVVQIGYVIANIALAVYTFKVRKNLAAFRLSGVTGLQNLYIFPLLLEVACALLMSVILDAPFGDSFTTKLLPSIVSSIVMIVANNDYYRKRRALFTE